MPIKFLILGGGGGIWFFFGEGPGGEVPIIFLWTRVFSDKIALTTYVSQEVKRIRCFSDTGCI